MKHPNLELYTFINTVKDYLCKTVDDFCEKNKDSLRKHTRITCTGYRYLFDQIGMSLILQNINPQLKPTKIDAKIAFMNQDYNHLADVCYYSATGEWEASPHPEQLTNTQCKYLLEQLHLIYSVIDTELQNFLIPDED